MITVGIADDEPLVRGGIRGLLEQAGDITVVAEAGNGGGAIELVRRHRPRVLLVDVTMPGVDGIAVAEEVRRTVPATSVVVLTARASDTHLSRALHAGASGILLKGGNPREVVAAVRAVAAGDAMLSPSITRRLLDRMAGVDLEPVEQARTLVGRLTAREKEVLGLVAKGMGNVQIARRLYVSEGAVKAHVSRLLTKLSCDNRVQAAILAHSARLAA
jgi:DNA-binding NarL/FixJ family response regulator